MKQLITDLYVPYRGCDDHTGHFPWSRLELVQVGTASGALLSPVSHTRVISRLCSLDWWLALAYHRCREMTSASRNPGACWRPCASNFHPGEGTIVLCIVSFWAPISTTRGLEDPLRAAGRARLYLPERPARSPLSANTHLSTIRKRRTQPASSVPCARCTAVVVCADITNTSPSTRRVVSRPLEIELEEKKIYHRKITGRSCSLGIGEC